MKFKYIGQDDTFCLELLAYNLMKKNECLKNGMVIDVPDDNKVVIDALDANGLFKRANVTVNRIKKKESKE